MFPPQVEERVVPQAEVFLRAHQQGLPVLLKRLRVWSQPVLRLSAVAEMPALQVQFPWPEPEAVSQQQAVSGVNLDEEAMKLMQYQKAYQASAKVMQTANSLFDTLLSMHGR